MSLDASDFVDNVLDEQARRNAAFAQPDIDQAVEDFQSATDPVGLVETLNRSATTGPHKWGDNQTAYGFWQWGS